VSRHDSKQGIFSNYFGGLSLSEYQDLCFRFSRSILPLICRKSAMNKLQAHLKDGDQVYLVSASPITYLQKWATQYPLNVIATKEEQNDLSLTGNFDGINCWGEEKAIQIKMLLDPSSFDEVHVYGNSKGDCGMFALATHSYYKSFDQPNIPPCK
jgi:phosphoserine phosphatase